MRESAGHQRLFLCVSSKQGLFGDFKEMCPMRKHFGNNYMSEERCGTRNRRALESMPMIQTGEKIWCIRVLPTYSPLFTTRSGLASNIINSLLTVVSSEMYRQRYRTYSSSPKNTFTGNQASPHTLNRSLKLSSFCISSVDKSHPSNSKFFSILA